MKDKTILLVEDNPDDVELTLRAFKKSNIMNRIHVVNDGKEALDYLFGSDVAEPGPKPSVVLLDLKLPRIDGLEVLRKMRADVKTQLLPVVILTSSKEDQDLVSGYQLGANSFIRKPIDFEQFAMAIHQLGLYWLVLNEPPPGD